MDKTKILLVDDHELILNGIVSMLKTIRKLIIVGQARNGKEAVEMAMELKPDIIIMDISMPVLNGIEASKQIMASLPDTKILALTQHEEDEYILQILRAGGYGYLLKNSKKEQFIDAIETVLRGEKYFSSKVTDLLLSEMLKSENAREKQDTAEVHLTKREIEIIRKIAEEMSNQEIADELHISLRTVETHRRNIMQKLNVKSVVSLVKYAVQNNIITLD